VERAPAALAVLRGNLAKLGMTTGFRIHEGSVGTVLRRMKPSAGVASGAAFDLVFLDPPYDAAEEYAATLNMLGGPQASLLAPGALIIAEHRKKEHLEDKYNALERTRLLEQGDAALSFYAKKSADPAS
jgi:16S rRNA G966 N2-methylase RsmD